MNKTKTSEDKAQVLKSSYKMGIKVERNNRFIAMLGKYVVFFGGIQLGRPQKIGLFGPPPPPCPHFRPQRPDPLPFRTSARPDPPLKKEKSLQNAWLQL